MKLWRKKQAEAPRPAVQVSRHTWETPGALTALSQIADAPRVDYTLYDALREGIPVIDAAISHLKRLVGTPQFVGTPRIVSFLQDFFSKVRILGYNQVGLHNFMRLHLDTLLTYGKAAAETVLTQSRDGIYGFKPIPVATLRLTPAANGMVEIRQSQAAAGLPVLLPEELLFYSVNNPRSGYPHGRSLLASLPFVGDIWLRMSWSLGQTWMRFGIPRYHVNADFGEQVGLAEEKMQTRLDAMATEFATGDQAARDMTSVKDFFSAGKVTIDVIGAEGANLNFQVPHRAIMEQIVTVTGLPPAWFGFSWAASERLASEQSIHATDLIASWRNELEPDILAVGNLAAALAGVSGEWGLKWNKVNLTDRNQQAQADMMEAQALAIRQKTAIESWRQGWRNQLEAAQEVYPELARVSLPKEEPAASTVASQMGVTVNQDDGNGKVSPTVADAMLSPLDVATNDGVRYNG